MGRAPGALSVIVSALAALGVACGSSIVGGEPADAGSVNGDAGEPQDAGDAGDAGEPQDAGDAGDAGEPQDAGADGGADAGALPDPNLDGPYTYQTLDDTLNVSATGDNGIAIHCAYPTSGPAPGPYPVVIVAHGLDLDASQYYGYLTRLASFGYVALTVDYPANPFSLTPLNNTNEAKDLLAGIDWAGSNATVGSSADTNVVGMTGHSLGGKLALLAATMDSRVKAAIVLDPVDGGFGSCSAPCVEVAPLMSGLRIPTGFLGETADSGGTNACAPAADNYTTFYANTNSPSLEVTVVGADHTSFLDSESSCGVVCDLCAAGTASNAEVVGLSHAYVAAFYERYIRGTTSYDAYLTGALAQTRYVTTGEITLSSK